MSQDMAPRKGFDTKQLSGTRGQKAHTLQTVHASIQEACESLESQIAEMEQDENDALREVKEVIDALSDLRRGKFAPTVGGEDIGAEVLATLKRLETVCADPAG